MECESEINEVGEENAEGVIGDAVIEDACERREEGGEGKEEKIELDEVGGDEGGREGDPVASDGGRGEETGRETVGRGSRSTRHSGSNHFHDVIFFNFERGSVGVGEGM